MATTTWPAASTLDDRVDGWEPSARERTDAIYREQSEALLRFVAARTRDSSIAEDVVQEAFARLALELRSGWRPDNPAGWLRRVAVNLVLSRGRRSGVAQRYETRLADDRQEPAPETVVLEREQAAAVRAELARLSPVERHAVLLAAHGYKGPEIARIIGRTEGATRTLLCRARIRIRAGLEDAGVE